MKTPDSPAKLRPGHSSNEGRKKYPRLRIEAALQQAKGGLTRAELVKLTDCSPTLVNETLRSMMRTDKVHHNADKPLVRFFLGPPPAKPADPFVVRPREINVWALPVYQPSRWNVRENAGKVVGA